MAVYTSVVLCDTELSDYECGRLMALHDEFAVHVVIPADTEQNPLLAALDDVVMGDLRDAFREREKVSDEQTARARAQAALDASVARLRALGVTADGEVCGDDPVPALPSIVERLDADELIVITRLKPVEDALHRDWASRARRLLRVPVLHAVAGTDWVLD